MKPNKLSSVNKNNKCFTLRLLLGFRVVRVYYLVVVVCYRLVYTVHCACLWAWLGSYCSGPVIRKHLSFRIMLPFRVALPSLYPPSFRRNDFFILYIYRICLSISRSSSTICACALRGVQLIYRMWYIIADCGSKYNTWSIPSASRRRSRRWRVSVRATRQVSS